MKNVTGGLGLFLILALISGGDFGGSARAATRHVPADYPTVQEAVEAAAAGDSILIAPGEYDGEFSVVKDLTITGDTTAPATVVLKVTQFFAGAGNGLVVEGLTFSGDLCTGPALFNETLTITDCIFEDFHFENSFGITLIFADATFERCLVRNNHNNASMFWILNCDQVTFDDCEFLDNSGGVGGVIKQFHSSPLQIRGCRFVGNHSGSYGGALHGLSNAVIDGCLFSANSADGRGGAVYGDGIIPCRITDCTMTGNSANEGGAVAADESFEFVLENVDFSLNTATVAGPEGWTAWGSSVSLVCCQADPLLWAGDGEVVIDDEGCGVGTRNAAMSAMKRMFR